MQNILSSGRINQFLFPVTELSLQPRQSEPSSSGGPRHQPPTPVTQIPPSLQKKFHWEKFRFPEDRHIQYFGKIEEYTGRGIRTLNTFKNVYTKKDYWVQVNEHGEIFGFKKRANRREVFRLFSSAYLMVAIKKDGDHPVRPLTNEEMAYLKYHPYGNLD